MYKGFSYSVMGASHEKRGIVCQDSSAFRVYDSWCVAVAADGHGSKKHFRSDVGSKFAVKAVLETVEDFFGASDDFEKLFMERHDSIIKRMEKQIIARWDGAINRHISEHPVTDKEREPFTAEEFDKIAVESYYGTTLMAAVTCSSFTFGIQIGDGTLVAVYNDGSTVTPMEYEESAPANITASICNTNACDMFNSFYTEEKPIALFASTDGLYTSFGSEYDFLDYHTIISSQLADYSEFEDTILKNLTKRSHFGTEDDITLSCVYDSELVSLKQELLTEKVDENREKAAFRKAEQLANLEKQRLKNQMKRRSSGTGGSN